MPAVHLQTEEGHDVELSGHDYERLNQWPSLDMTRLVVVGEDAVHARRTDGTVHPISLEDLLAVVEAPKPAPAPPVARLPVTGTVAPGSLLDYFQRTGEARASRRPKALATNSERMPVVLVAGQPKRLVRTEVVAGRARVPVVALDSRDVVAWAYVPVEAHQALRTSPGRPDTLAWRMASGRPHARVRPGPGHSRLVPVVDLLAQQGHEPAALQVVALES